MGFKLKRVKSFLWLNSKISAFFFKWIKVIDYRKSNSKLLIQITPSFTFKIGLNKYKIPRTPFWKSFSQFVSDKIYYVKIKDATIISKGIVLSDNNEVVLESTIFQLEYLQVLSSNHVIKFQNILPSLKEEKVMNLLNKLDNNYYHWTLESLTRLLLVHDLPFFENYKIVIKSGALPFVKESLAFLFQINSEQLTEKPLHKRLLTKETLVVSFPHIRNKATENINVYYPFIIKKLNELALKRLSEKGIEVNPHRNIIISRKNTIERRIKNEKALLDSLKEFNFETVVLETLSFLEQVTLFANTRMVIASHGAGITNIIYGNNCLLIEMFPKNRNIRDAYYFAQITDALQINHHVFLYEEINEKQDVILDDNMIQEINEIIINFTSNQKQKL